MVNGKYYTFKEAQEVLSLKKLAIYKLVERGYVIMFKDKSGRNLIPKESIDKYLEDCLMEAEG
ncbi:MAG: helix-turn-helix domain-containing protein [Massilibacteroides sp.]|nr:helix-turn-helix domain-containing protein [Massilibacteroides sp.]MDD4115209.1 helix-turn-helix domain-containing protein [Massilibacteroides sp.]